MRMNYRCSSGILAMVFLTIVSAPYTYSQQDLYFTNSRFIGTKNNPAYTGNENLDNLMILTRQQWVGFEGAPKSYFLGTHFRLPDENLAAGVDLMRTTYGPVRETGVWFNYSYTIRTGERSVLSMGLRGGIDIMAVTLSRLSLSEPGDNLFSDDIKGKVNPNIGFGLHFQTERYYIDVAVPTLFRNSLSPKTEGTSPSDNLTDRLFIFGGGMDFDIASNIKMLPSLTLWSVNGAPLLIDMNIGIACFDTFGGSLGLRSGNSVGCSLWYKTPKNIRAGYSYELPASGMYGSNIGSHELYLGYNFSFLKLKTASPRKF